jgi:hypothetical protein
MAEGGDSFGKLSEEEFQRQVSAVLSGAEDALVDDEYYNKAPNLSPLIEDIVDKLIASGRLNGELKETIIRYANFNLEDGERPARRLWMIAGLVEILASISSHSGSRYEKSSLLQDHQLGILADQDLPPELREELLEISNALIFADGLDYTNQEAIFRDVELSRQSDRNLALLKSLRAKRKGALAKELQDTYGHHDDLDDVVEKILFAAAFNSAGPETNYTFLINSASNKLSQVVGCEKSDATDLVRSLIALLNGK